MFSYKICEIFKNTYFEERLRKTASICFTSKNTIANSGGEFGLDLDSAKYFFFKRNSFIQSNAAIQFIC